MVMMISVLVRMYGDPGGLMDVRRIEMCTGGRLGLIWQFWRSMCVCDTWLWRGHLRSPASDARTMVFKEGSASWIN